jgi:hypothetical protein
MINRSRGQDIRESGANICKMPVSQPGDLWAIVVKVSRQATHAGPAGPSIETPKAAAVQTSKSDLQPDDKPTLDCDAPARQPGALRVRLVVLGAQQPGVAAGWVTRHGQECSVRDTHNLQLCGPQDQWRAVIFASQQRSRT